MWKPENVFICLQCLKKKMKAKHDLKPNNIRRDVWKFPDSTSKNVNNTDFD